MSESFMRVHFEDRHVRRALREMNDAGTKGLVKVFRRLRMPLQANLLSHAEREASPDGAWRRRAAATEAELKRTGPAKRSKTTRERRRRMRDRKRKGVSGPRFSGTMSGPLRETKTTTTYANILGGLPISVGISVEKRGPTLIARTGGAMALAHNEGATVGRGARIPARPFVFIDVAWAQDVALPAMVEYVHATWRKA